MLRSLAGRLYFPFLPWAFEVFRDDRRARRAVVHGAFFASRRLSGLRGRHHQRLQQEMTATGRHHAWWMLLESVASAGSSAVLAVALFSAPVVASGEVAVAAPGEIVAAVGFLLGVWLVAAVVLVPLLTFTGAAARVTTLAAGVGIGVGTAAVAHGRLGLSAWLLGSALGCALVLLALLATEGKPAARARERVGWMFVALFLFVPFLAADLLLAPGYTGWAVVADTLVASAVVGVVGVVLSMIYRLRSPNFRATIGALLVVLAVVVLLVAALPRGATWPMPALRGGLLAAAAGLAAMVVVVLAYTVVSGLTIRLLLRRDPEGEIVRAMLFLVLDLEFGVGWRDLPVPDRGDDRAARRWVRRKLRARSEGLTGDGFHQLANRLDGTIWLLHRTFPAHLTVLHDDTNEYVRRHARHMAATIASWQRRLLIRGAAPVEELVAPALRCLDAALTRRWGLFDTIEVEAPVVSRRTRVLAAARHLLVALVPLAAVVALAVSPLAVSEALLGSLATFALTWLAANVLRAIDPGGFESLEVAEKLGGRR